MIIYGKSVNGNVHYHCGGSGICINMDGMYGWSNYWINSLNGDLCLFFRNINMSYNEEIQLKGDVDIMYITNEQYEFMKEVAEKHEDKLSDWCEANRSELLKWFNDNMFTDLNDIGQRFGYYCVVKFMEHKSEVKTEE